MKDGRLGSQLRASHSDCSGFVPGRSEAPEPNAGPGCTIFASSAAASSATTFRLRGRSLAKLALDLQVFTDRPVRDDTGRAGVFDVEVSFVYPTARAPVQPGQDDITLFTALQDSLA